MKKDINKSLHHKNVKPTAMRQLVLDILSKQDHAIGLQELENHFEKVDRTTLYRTLKTFVENKIAHSIDDGSGSIKYAICKDTCHCHPDDLHVHFYCVKCKKTLCLTDIPVPDLHIPKDYQIDNINVVVKGLCDHCK